MFRELTYSNLFINHRSEERNFGLEIPVYIFQVSYLGVDTLMSRSPPLVKDKYFDDDNLKLPYTEASVAYKKKTYRGSVHDMQ
jgi:hypothetical protein